MEDSEIVGLFWARSEAAIGETEKKYGAYCRYIALRILNNPEDADEAVADAYMRLWTTVPPERPRSLKAYLGALCRNIALDALRKNAAGKRGGEAALAGELNDIAAPLGGDMEDAAALREALNGFLASLPKRARVVFLRRYWYACTVPEIARDLRMGESAVGMSLSRSRGKLRKYLEKEGFIVER